MPEGRRLIAAFVGGAVAASLLFALPLHTIRERVGELEEDHAALRTSLNQTAGHRLVDAGEAVGTADLSEPGASGLASAHAHVASARGMINLTDPGDGQALRALDRAEGVLGQAADAAGCDLLPLRSPPGRALPMLAQGLSAMGQRLVDGERPAPAQVEGAAVTLGDALGPWLERSTRIENATLSVGNQSTHVQVTLAGQLPAERCRGSFEVEVCRIAERTEGCVTWNGTDGPFEVLGQQSFEVPVPAPLDETQRVTVTVRDVQAGVHSSDTCELAPRDGASCPTG